MLARMRVLALYDIHGNVEALDAVLADSRAAGADVVVVGGDVVPGPFAAATLARLEALSVPVHWVRGNGEREVAAAVGAPPAAPEDLGAATAARRRPSSARSGRSVSVSCRSPSHSTPCCSVTPARAATMRCSRDCPRRSAGHRHWRA